MNIYVGNIAYSMSDEDLRNAFAAYGTVNSAKIIIDKRSGRSKGYGFVEMGSEAEGENAIAGLNGQEVKGRALRVNKAIPREDDNR